MLCASGCRFFWMINLPCPLWWSMKDPMYFMTLRACSDICSRVVVCVNRLYVFNCCHSNFAVHICDVGTLLMSWYPCYVLLKVMKPLYSLFSFFWHTSPPWPRSASFTSFLAHTQHLQQTDIHAPGGIQTHSLSRQGAADLRLRPRSHWDRQTFIRALIL